MNVVTEITSVGEDIKETMRRAATIGLHITHQEAMAIVGFEDKAETAYGGIDAADLTDRLMEGLRDSLRAKPTLVDKGIEKLIARDNIVGAFLSHALLVVGKAEPQVCRDIIKLNTDAFCRKSAAPALR